MRCAGLQCLTVLHHRFDCVGRIGAGETFRGSLLTSNHRHRHEIFRKVCIDVEHLACFAERLFSGRMRSVAFLPEELGSAQKESGAHFPTHDIGPLIN